MSVCEQLCKCLCVCFCSWVGSCFSARIFLHCKCLHASLSFPHFLSHSLSLPVCCTRGRGLTGTSAHVHVSSTYRWARLSTHRQRATSMRSPCSHAHFGRLTAACVSSQGDWAVSVGSHMRLYIQVHRFLCLKTLTSVISFEKLAIVLPATWLSSVRVATCVVRPAGRQPVINSSSSRLFLFFRAPSHWPCDVVLCVLMCNAS